MPGSLCFSSQGTTGLNDSDNSDHSDQSNLVQNLSPSMIAKLSHSQVLHLLKSYSVYLAPKKVGGDGWYVEYSGVRYTWAAPTTPAPPDPSSPRTIHVMDYEDACVYVLSDLADQHAYGHL